MTGPEYFSLAASGRLMLLIGRSYFYSRDLPLSLLSIHLVPRQGRGLRNYLHRNGAGQLLYYGCDLIGCADYDVPPQLLPALY